jgi:hypothetical protein
MDQGISMYKQGTAMFTRLHGGHVKVVPKIKSHSHELSAKIMK